MRSDTAQIIETTTDAGLDIGGELVLNEADPVVPEFWKENSIIKVIIANGTRLPAGSFTPPVFEVAIVDPVIEKIDEKRFVGRSNGFEVARVEIETNARGQVL